MKHKKLTKSLTTTAVSISMLSSMCMSVNALESIDVTDLTSTANIGTGMYGYDASKLATINSRCPYTLPTYVIFPDEAITSTDEASTLFDQLGIKQNVQDYTSAAYIINPTGEDGYTTTDDDLTTFMSYLDSRYSSNMNTKVIGIGKGATFVNDVVAPHDWALAGIMTYGGTINAKTPASKYHVPTYISNSDANVANYYKNTTGATQQSTGTNATVFTNPSNELETVSIASNNTESLSEAFQNAWVNTFSQNSTVGNIGQTFYMAKLSQERKFELSSFSDFDLDNITKNVLTDDLDNDGKDSLWYEYYGNSFEGASEKSVPLILLLHGNGNDARQEAETAGFFDVMEDENIMLLEPEWTGGTYYGTDYDAMTEDENLTANSDIVKLVKDTMKKYPQIDPSRVYVEGMSRGGVNTFNISMSNPDVFAAASVHSGVSGEVEKLTDLASQFKDGQYMPMFMTGGTADSQFPMSPSTTDRTYFTSLSILKGPNGIDVPETYEFDDSIPYFGYDFDGQDVDFVSGDVPLFGETFSNEKGLINEVVAIEKWGHWNYAPNARLMYDFMSHYQRDTETGETIILGDYSTEVSSVEDLIAQLPTDVTKENYDSVKEQLAKVSSAYNALFEQQKDTVENMDVYQALLAKFNAYKPEVVVTSNDNKTTASVKSVKTGDDSNLGLFATVSTIAVLAAGYVLTKIKKA